jgi:type IV secretory pathway protease TraF
MSDKRIALCATLAATLLVLLYVLFPRNVFLVNTTDSVPIGLYIKASPETARYVSFCLRKEHEIYTFYPHYCSADHPDGRGLLKRIHQREEDGALLVAGDTFNAIDTRLIGAVRSSQIRGFWQPLLVL